jgi:hypothetical protein
MANAIRRDMKKLGQEGADSLLKDFDKTLRNSADRRLRGSQLALADAITGGNFDSLLKKSGQSVEDFTSGIRADLMKMNRDSRISFRQFQTSLDTLDKWATTTVSDQKMHDVALALERQNRAWLTYGRNVVAAEKTAKKVKLTEMERSIVRLNRDLDKISVGGGIGRIFGKGSRNDFINFIGSAVGGLVGLTETVLKFPFKLIEQGFAVWDNLKSTFKTLQDANGTGSALLTMLGGAAKAAVPALIAAGLAVAGLVTILPGIASAASLAVGGITAIVGALTYGLLGALLPLVPLIAAVLAGVAPLVLGIVGLTAALKGNKKSVAGIKEDWRDFQKQTRPFIHDFTEEVGKWAGMLDGLTPLFSDMGDAVLDVLSYLRELLTSKEMKPFLETWGTTLPLMFDNLGRGVDALLAAFIAFFAPIVPYAERLSANFETLAENFLAWATSKPGQNAIADFMADAWAAANSLWDIIGNIAGAIAATFGAGQAAAGQPFLDWLDEVTQKWQTWAESPAGQTELKQWFTDAKEAGEKLFTIIGEIFTFFQELDTEQARKDLLDFLDSMKQLGADADSIAGGITTIATTVHSLFTILDGFSVTGFLTNVASIGPNVAAAGAATWGAIQFWFGQIGAQINGAIAGVPAALVSPWRIGLGLVTGVIAAIVASPRAALSGVPGAIAAVLASVPAALLAPFHIGRGQIAAVLLAIVALIPGFNFGRAAAAAVGTVLYNLTHPFVAARDTISRIMREIQGFIDRIPGLKQAAQAGRSVVDGLVQGMRDRLSSIPGMPRLAAGGITDGPSIAGEAGRELVIPLERPLALVDPSVRALAAMLRGQNGAAAGVGLSVAEGAVKVYTQVKDPELLADMVLDRIVAGAR